jgi:hypothetical protein
MTTHELAKKLLEGPDVKVVIQGHEPNDDTFDVIESVDTERCWQLDYTGKRFGDTLYDGCRSYPHLTSREVEVVVLR